MSATSHVGRLPSRRGRGLLLLGPLLLVTLCAWPCDIPVWQWALANWDADPYELFVFHDGSLTESDLSLSQAGGEEASPNLLTHLIDVNQPMDEEAAFLWEAAGDPATPWMVLMFPRATRIPVQAWAGPYGPGALASVADSPARQSLRAALLSGAPAAWLFLDSGDAAKDAAAHDVLVSQLAVLWSEGDVPVVRVSRTDQQEAVLMSLLLATEPDLSDYDAPLAFPVFGKGRLLYALVGAGINADTIEEAWALVMGPCSCVLKDDNPGVDLLMIADWDAATQTASTAADEDGLAESATATAPSAPPVPDDMPESADVVTPLWVYVAAGLGAAFLAVLALTVLPALLKGAANRDAP